MEETAKDWVARPNDADLDRGSIAQWFVVQLAESLQLEAPPPGERSARPAPTPGPSPAPAPAPAPDAPEVILVEDDPALAGLLEYGLRARGYRFVTFRNGREALDALLALDVGELHPLLLLDVDLPALDGYSILDTLTRERPGQYRVVFTTVHGDESEQLRRPGAGRRSPPSWAGGRGGGATGGAGSGARWSASGGRGWCAATAIRAGGGSGSKRRAFCPSPPHPPILRVCSGCCATPIPPCTSP